MAKAIKIDVDTGKTLPLSYFEPLQGDLKELTPEASKKLRQSILKHGFIFPFFVWEDQSDTKIKIIDGHQRFKVLNELKDEGYKIPQLPVIFIPASNINDAKAKLVSAASYFGKFTQKGVDDYLASFDFDPEEMFGTIDIPFASVTFESIGEKVPVTAHEREIKNTSAEIDLNDYSDFEHTCPKCGFEYNGT